MSSSEKKPYKHPADPRTIFPSRKSNSVSENQDTSANVEKKMREDDSKIRRTHKMKRDNTNFDIQAKKRKFDTVNEDKSAFKKFPQVSQNKEFFNSFPNATSGNDWSSYFSLIIPSNSEATTSTEVGSQVNTSELEKDKYKMTQVCQSSSYANVQPAEIKSESIDETKKKNNSSFGFSYCENFLQMPETNVLSYDNTNTPMNQKFDFSSNYKIDSNKHNKLSLLTEKISSVNDVKIYESDSEFIILLKKSLVTSAVNNKGTQLCPVLEKCAKNLIVVENNPTDAVPNQINLDVSKQLNDGHATPASENVFKNNQCPVLETTSVPSLNELKLPSFSFLDAYRKCHPEIDEAPKVEEKSQIQMLMNSLRVKNKNPILNKNRLLIDSIIQKHISQKPKCKPSIDKKKAYRFLDTRGRRPSYSTRTCTVKLAPYYDTKFVELPSPFEVNEIKEENHIKEQQSSIYHSKFMKNIVDTSVLPTTKIDLNEDILLKTALKMPQASESNLEVIRNIKLSPSTFTKRTGENSHQNKLNKIFKTHLVNPIQRVIQPLLFQKSNYPKQPTLIPNTSRKGADNKQEEKQHLEYMTDDESE